MLLVVDVEEALSVRLDVLLAVVVLADQGRCRDDVGHGLLVRRVDDVSVNALRHGHNREYPVQAGTLRQAVGNVGQAENLMRVRVLFLDAPVGVKNLETEVEAIQKKYEDFYKEKGEDKLKEFQKAVEDLENDPEIKKQLEDAQNQMMEKVMKLMSETKG